MKLINPVFSLAAVPLILAVKDIKIKLKGGTDDNCFDKIGNFISCKAGAALNTFIYDNDGFICLKADEEKPIKESRCITKTPERLVELPDSMIRHKKFKLHPDGMLVSKRVCIASNGEKLVKVWKNKEQCILENKTGLDWIGGQFKDGDKCLAAVWSEAKGNYIAKFKNCDSRHGKMALFKNVDARGRIQHDMMQYLCLALKNGIVDLDMCPGTDKPDQLWSWNAETKTLKYDDKCIVKRKKKLVAIDCLKPIEFLE